jgi:hypothetical protein
MSQLRPSPVLASGCAQICALSIETVQGQVAAAKGTAPVTNEFGKRECIWRNMRDYAFCLTGRPKRLTQSQQQVTAPCRPEL